MSRCETCGWIGDHTREQCIDQWGSLFKLIVRAFGPTAVAEMYETGRAAQEGEK